MSMTLESILTASPLVCILALALLAAAVCVALFARSLAFNLPYTESSHVGTGIALLVGLGVAALPPAYVSALVYVRGAERLVPAEAEIMSETRMVSRSHRVCPCICTLPLPGWTADARLCSSLLLLLYVSTVDVFDGYIVCSVVSFTHRQPTDHWRGDIAVPPAVGHVPY